LTPQKDSLLAKLLDEAQKGDQNSYEKFLFEVSRELASFFRKRVFRREQTEEILQETLMSIHRARHTYEPGRLISPWLFAIARSRLIDFYRRQRAIENHEIPSSYDDGIEVPRVTPDDDAAMVGEKLLMALNRLPESQKRIILLLKFENMSVKEASGILGLSEAAVKMSASRGYKLLRKYLKKAGYED
jgi:RNA polymerase sigma-70 factor (ECF subfamily)